MEPASSEMRQARKMGRMPCGVLKATQAPSTMLCRVWATSTPQAPDSHGVCACSASAPPRKPMTAIAKHAPQARPYSADLLNQACSDSSCPRGGSDSSSTPTVAITMAASARAVGSSCRNTAPNRATCRISVLDSVTATAKLRSFMASSSAAVAATWNTAPSVIQPR